MSAFTELSQEQIEQLSPEEFSYFLSTGFIDDFEETEYQHLIRHLVEYDV